MSEEAINNASREISSPFLNYCNQLLFCPISGMLLGFHCCLNLQFQHRREVCFLVSCYDFAFPYAFFSFYAMISRFCGVGVRVSISKTNIVYLCFFFNLFGFLICVFFFLLSCYDSAFPVWDSVFSSFFFCVKIWLFYGLVSLVIGLRFSSLNLDCCDDYCLKDESLIISWIHLQVADLRKVWNILWKKEKY